MKKLLFSLLLITASTSVFAATTTVVDNHKGISQAMMENMVMQAMMENMDMQAMMENMVMQAMMENMDMQAMMENMDMQAMMENTNHNMNNHSYLSDYTVKKGDTLGSIANKFYGVNSISFVEKIAKKNHISNVNEIYVNEKLIIPLNGDGPVL